MQLFHIEIDKVRIKWNNIEIFSVPELVSQLRKVLRIKKWDKVFIQFSSNNQTTRYKISVVNRTDKDLYWEIISNQIFSFPTNHISMLVAMPNKWEKAELIVQKLTEIGVENIYFWVSEHSIIRQWNDKKACRLNKISHEAVEQSRWIQIPLIGFIELENDLKMLIEWKDVIIANHGWIPYWELKSITNNVCWVIGPEWWFSEKDLKIFNGAKIIDLWNNVLRMETASIILGWILKNK